MPRVAPARKLLINATSAAASGLCAASSSIAERAWSSVRPSRYSSLGICLTAALRPALKSRRRNPITLNPRTVIGLPSTSMNGGTSCDTALAKPTIACAPIFTNWWIPLNPPTVTQSPEAKKADVGGQDAMRDFMKSKSKDKGAPKETAKPADK